MAAHQRLVTQPKQLTNWRRIGNSKDDRLRWNISMKFSLKWNIKCRSIFRKLINTSFSLTGRNICFRVMASILTEFDVMDAFYQQLSIHLVHSDICSQDSTNRKQLDRVTWGWGQLIVLFKNSTFFLKLRIAFLKKQFDAKSNGNVGIFYFNLKFKYFRPNSPIIDFSPC